MFAVTDHYSLFECDGQISLFDLGNLGVHGRCADTGVPHRLDWYALHVLKNNVVTLLIVMGQRIWLYIQWS